MRHARRIAVLLTLLGLGAAACSSTSSSGDASSPAGTTAETTAGMPAGTARTTPANPYGAFTSPVYADPVNWLCRPEATDDPCHGDLDATVLDADGTSRVEPAPPAATDPPIDCFYVYPTISTDNAANSDLVPGPEERNVVVQQAARLRSQCRVFAPMYRQNTLGSLMGSVPSDVPVAERQEMAYGDVVDAWKQYIANDNDGRGVVLIGHSQGTFMLTRLVGEEIDDEPALLDRLVGAYLIGGSVTVPEGELVGGSFQHVPVCETQEQIGCVVAFSSFRSTQPPTEGGFFGKPRQGGGQVVCANPAGLDGGDVALDAFFPAGAQWLGPLAAEVTTPFVQVPGLVTGECVLEDGFSYLRITVHPDPADSRPDDIPGDLTPGWGLHLVDVNLVMGDIVSMVEAQSAAYAAS